MSAAILMLPALAQAQTSRVVARAGSNFSDSIQRYGRISRRPYRRRQKPVSHASGASVSKFDYRLETAVTPDATMLEAYAESSEFFDGEQGGLDDRGQASFERVGYCDGYCDSCGDTCYGSCVEPSCGCDDDSEPGCGCEESCRSAFASFRRGFGSTWKVGFEWTFVKPRFSENMAFTTMDSDGNNSSTFIDTEFDFNLELTPRVWIEAPVGDSWSWRLSYWQFDHSPTAVTTSPNSNGFGEITHPSFGDVDISTTIPNDTFSTSSALSAYTIDLEALKRARLSDWQLGVGGGLRYASTEQNYVAQLQNVGNDVLGQINFTHKLEGFGPTISLSARRPLMRQIKLVCAARGSLLFGEGQSRLDASEDTTPSTTLRLTRRDDLLPIGEARIGLEWLTPKKHRQSWQWLLSTALEGQVWGNAGNASSETTDLGFFGFNVGAGWLR